METTTKNNTEERRANQTEKPRRRTKANGGKTRERERAREREREGDKERKRAPRHPETGALIDKVVGLPNLIM